MAGTRRWGIVVNGDRGSKRLIKDTYCRGFILLVVNGTESEKSPSTGTWTAMKTGQKQLSFPIQIHFVRIEL